MRGGRLLVIIGIIVLLGAVAVGAILWIRNRADGGAVPEGTPTAEVYVPPETQVLVAAEDIWRGESVTADSVQSVPWPDESVPARALTEADIEEELVDRFARVDILQGMPITEDMLTDKSGELGAVGSDAALQIPEGMVAYAMPVSRYSSVAWALQPGDHVDVLISLLIKELDEEFQTALPNKASCVQPAEGEGCESGTMGRLEVLPNGWVVNLIPRENQRARLVTQLTVQDAVVLRVGDWPTEGREVARASREPELVEGVEGQGSEVEPVEGEVTPTPPARASVEPLTLVVTPQDAMVLKYALELGANVDLVLRSPADEKKEFDTSSVTLEYLFDEFGIEVPEKLPYGITPPLESVPSVEEAEVENPPWGEPVEE
jgi:Flp pilus assembly protein CpaB